MNPVLKFIILVIVLLMFSFLFNALTANTFNILKWKSEAIFMSVLYSSSILLLYFISLINDCEMKEHNYLDDTF